MLVLGDQTMRQNLTGQKAFQSVSTKHNQTLSSLYIIPDSHLQGQITVTRSKKSNLANVQKMKQTFSGVSGIIN